jgi:alkanesulfonate monooxygenase SsuD/methylene tetrahydromethanopterin reductase-like flavin-dependent oxidoreductase (luciferase family)
VKISMTLPTMVPGFDGRLLRQWCARIEAGPFASIAAGERITYGNTDLFTTLAAAAACTDRVRLVATVVVLPLHSAALVAKQAATVDVLSGGRLTVGVGIGGRDEDFRAAGAPFDHRHQRMDDQVAEMRRLWMGAPAYEGASPIGPPPVQVGGPPLLAGSLGPKSIARAAQWAAGVAGFVTDPDPAAVRAGFAQVEQAWADAGRADTPYRTTSFWYGLGPDGEDRARDYGFRYLKIFGDDFAKAMADSMTMTSSDALRDGISGLLETGCDELFLVPTSADLSELDRTIEVLAGVGGLER